LVSLFDQWSRRYERTMPAAALHRLLVEAAREFNAGRYFEAHEVLEEGLDDVPDHLWGLFVGLIQIAVGYHKTTQQLWSGALGMLQQALEKVEPFPPEAVGLNLEALRQRVRADIAKLRSGCFDSAAFARQPPRLQPLSQRSGSS
jgi:predicted metal-dependent hydrolase